MSSWIKNIDTLSFKIHTTKRYIPKEFYSPIGIERRNQIANLHGNFNPGCSGLGKGRRLNWIANDENGHWIISISRGGRAYNTSYYFIAKEKGEIKLNRFSFYGFNRKYYNLGLSIRCLKLGYYYQD